MKKLKLLTLLLLFSFGTIGFSFFAKADSIDDTLSVEEQENISPKNTESSTLSSVEETNPQTEIEAGTIKEKPAVIIDNFKGGTFKDVKMKRISDTDDTITFVVDKPSVADVKILNLPYRLFIDVPMPYRWKVPQKSVAILPVSIVQGFRYSNPSEEIFRVSVDLTRSSYLRRVYTKEILGENVVNTGIYIPNIKDKNTQQSNKSYEFNIDISSSSRGGVSTLSGANSIVFSNDKVVLQEITDISKEIDEKGKQATRGKSLEIKIKKLLEDIRYKKPTVSDLSRPVRVFIDPGHGGKDPGAISSDKSIQEKDLVLTISKEIQKQLEENKEISVILSRTGDYYVPLNDRILWAQHLGADIFISIHADNASTNAGASGLSVYTLSESASDLQTQTLANTENQSDLVAGINLNNDDAEVNNILLSLSQRVKSNESIYLARSIVGQASKTTKVMANPIRSAGFAVLKLPSTPSVLVELGFLSNKADVQEFKKDSYSKKIAVTLSTGIEYYLWKKGKLKSFPVGVVSAFNGYVDKDIAEAMKKTKVEEKDAGNVANASDKK